MSLTENHQRAPAGIMAKSHSQASPSDQRERYELLYAPVADEMAAVETILQQQLVSRYDGVNELLQHGARLSGKRLRPALLLLTAKACGAVRPAHLKLAAVLEMIHTATLVHDDVLDDATIRRHHSTVNALAGNEASVLLGDFLFSHSFYLASTLDNTFACQRIGRTTNIVCEGEMRQIHHRGNFNLTEAEYIEIIAAKTSQLCACCCELGAHYADASDERQQALYEYGNNLGIAFQIIDDVLDIAGDPMNTGKSLGSDLEKEKLTLPLIRLLNLCSDVERDALVYGILREAGQRRDDLLDQLETSGALEYARNVAKRYANAAQDQLRELAPSPAREALLHLARFVVQRHH
ncbi:MAG: polyprenyl synthetase family protein [Pirellulales bacterium]